MPHKEVKRKKSKKKLTISERVMKAVSKKPKSRREAIVQARKKTMARKRKK